ncbi:MAG TPA: hypothetical protein V6C97_00725 [Oculatellaceae cyanobacterium]
MSHYNVNASVPKTMIQFLIKWVAEKNEFGNAASAVLLDILNTEISPELVPASDAAASAGDSKKPAQSTEQTIGPYNLNDFSLYYITRRGFSPSKVAFLSQHAWKGKYSQQEILHWLRAFLDRFFRTSQFKRSCVPNSIKIGDGSSLSPRGDWRAPSDSSSVLWLNELDAAKAWIEASANSSVVEHVLPNGKQVQLVA